MVKVGSYFGLGRVERLSATSSQFYAKYSDLLVLFGLGKKKVRSVFRTVGSDTKGHNIT
jgi:hypothetical protein